MPLTCILLAAGSSSRLGRPKQLVTFRGRPLIRHAAETAIEAGVPKLVVIVPAASPDIVAALDGLVLETIENPGAAEGIASSIRLGVGKTSGPWLLLLCDQPLVTQQHLRALMAAGGPIAATQHRDGHPGVPALFDVSMRDELMGLRGDQGARRILEAHRDSLHRIEFVEASVDVDTEEDVARFE